MLDISLKTERQFKGATGYSKAEFAALLSDLEATFVERYGQNYETYVEENVTEPPKLKSLSDCLLFVLFQTKNGLIWDSLGVVFNMSTSAAHQNYVKYLELLEATLKKRGAYRNANLKM